MGKGITVAAQQALLLRDALGTRLGLQRRLDHVADFCWSVATSEDLRQPTSEGRQNVPQRIIAAWSAERRRLAVAGDPRAFRTFARVYHLMAPARALFHPALFLAAARSALRGRGRPAPRPEVLEALRQSQPA